MTVKKNDKKLPRGLSVKIRLHPEELAKLDINRAGKPLATWLRELGLGTKKRQRITHELPPEVVRILSGIGSNLNQISRNINTAQKAGRLDLAQGLLPLMSQLRSTEKALDLVREFLSKEP